MKDFRRDAIEHTRKQHRFGCHIGRSEGEPVIILSVFGLRSGRSRSRWGKGELRVTAPDASLEWETHDFTHVGGAAKVVKG